MKAVNASGVITALGAVPAPADRGGYTRAGLIPRYAQDPDGPLIDTVIYYKELAP